MPRPLPGLKPNDSRSATLLQSYKQTLFWSRISLAAFAVVYVAILIWAIPWLPYGLSEEDYNPQLIFLVILLFAASGTAYSAMHLRDSRRRIEQTLETLNSVNSGLSDSRQREYFYDRIVIECQRAQADGTQFTVALINLGTAGDAAGRHRSVREELAPLVKERECVGSISQHEIGVLAPQIGQHAAAQFTRRLKQTATQALGEGLADTVHAAYAVYGLDATDPGELVGLARSRTLAFATEAGRRTQDAARDTAVA